MAHIENDIIDDFSTPYIPYPSADAGNSDTSRSQLLAASPTTKLPGSYEMSASSMPYLMAPSRHSLQDMRPLQLHGCSL